MKVDVLSIKGEKTGKTVELPGEIFGIEPNEHAVYLSVKQYLANQRQGTHKAKERSDISGSTRKLKKQKGTGTARAGSIKNTEFRGGPRAFGPRPRTYGIQLNKKVKSLARRSALSAKAAAGQVFVIEDFTFDAPKTNEYVNILRNLKVDAQKSILVTNEHDNVLYRSSRNVPHSMVVVAGDLNAYDVLNADQLVFVESSINTIKQLFA